MFRIMDWAYNDVFRGKTFVSFDEAEEFLCEYFEQSGKDYEEDRGEYEIIEEKGD